MNEFMSFINSSFQPNSTRLARFCNVLAIKVNALADFIGGWSRAKLNSFGPRMAGQKNRKKRKPATTVYLTSLDFCVSWCPNLAVTFV